MYVCCVDLCCYKYLGSSCSICALTHKIRFGLFVVLSHVARCLLTTNYVGKTTQLPQYILESEIKSTNRSACSIICTQPRQISSMEVSERVAAERGEELGEIVGYKVRLKGQRGRDTRLLFCTIGILSRRLLHDKSLKGVTHVIVDKIHEHGMNEVIQTFFLSYQGTFFHGVQN